MTNEPLQEDLNAVLLSTIRQFEVEELTKKDQKIDITHRLMDNGSMIIDITNRQKQKKVIVIYADGQIITTPKARRRINEGTRYIPAYVEINANVRHYSYGNEEYKKSITSGFASSILKPITEHLVRELLNDTGYPIHQDERIHASAGRINDTVNTYLIDHANDTTPPETEYYRVVSLNTDDCFDKDDRVRVGIVDSINYSAYLAGKASYQVLISDQHAPKIGDANVGDYVVVYHAVNTDGNRKVVRYIPPPTFSRWFRT